ncbi:hypothetical protein [Comamonas odontotermitis]|uniref:hypothetical protein n=1 Tax=Comamonas odontotermitis TaxID=379895 RepID=UPI001CC5F6B6|nr:hypothetical protein [Comamonas odontotermitis]UBB15404.1 hypothetical protein LAD35_11015 [Comamonas odontotermitis]
MNPVHIVLLVSLALNGLLGWAYLGKRDDFTRATTSLNSVRTDLNACSDATEDLRELANRRAADAKKLRADAAAKAKPLERRADYTLSLQPRDPLNACSSMQHLGDEWLKGRAAR